jgi:hypothetical protein
MRAGARHRRAAPAALPRCVGLRREPVEIDLDSGDDRVARLERLARLHEQGVLSGEGPEAEKRRALGEP